MDVQANQAAGEPNPTDRGTPHDAVMAEYNRLLGRPVAPATTTVPPTSEIDLHDDQATADDLVIDAPSTDDTVPAKVASPPLPEILSFTDWCRCNGVQD